MGCACGPTGPGQKRSIPAMLNSKLEDAKQQLLANAAEVAHSRKGAAAIRTRPSGCSPTTTAMRLPRTSRAEPGRHLRRRAEPLPAGADGRRAPRAEGLHTERSTSNEWAVRSQRDRDRHRRHAVPRRLGDDGAGHGAPASTSSSTRRCWSAATSPASSLEGSTPRPAEATAPRPDPESWMHVEIDRETDPASSCRSSRPCAASSATSARSSRTRQDERPGARHR